MHVCRFSEDPRGVRLCNVPVMLAHVEDQIRGYLITRNLKPDKANPVTCIDMGRDRQAIDHLDNRPWLRFIHNLVSMNKFVPT